MRKTAAPLTLILMLLAATFMSVAKPAYGTEVTENSWVTKAPMNEARGGLGVAAVNGKVYAIGGSTQQGLSDQYAKGIVGTNEEYDPTTDTWTFNTPMPTPRVYFAITVHQNKIYCIGGYTRNSSLTGANEAYDSATDTWETKKPMPTPRALLRANGANGKIYLIGGNGPNSYLTLNEVYDPATDSWNTRAPLPTATATYASAVVDNKIYVINSLNQIYNVENDSWSHGAPLLDAFGGVGVATSGFMAPKRIYVLGLMSYDDPSGSLSENSVRAYDPEMNSWYVGAALPTKRHEFGVAIVDDVLYAIGGQSYEQSSVPYVPSVTLYATNEQYTPLRYGTIPPVVSIVSKENQTYNSSSLPVTFAVNKQTVWMGYSLDGGETLTVTGNFTLTELSNGLHNLTVYANDTLGNIGLSETSFFSVFVPEPENEVFPVLPVAIAIVAVIIVAAGLLLYNRKRRREATQK